MTSQSGEWLSIREAAVRLGTSELTVRRRIKDGRLEHRLEGGKYFVLLPAAASAQEGRSAPRPRSTPTPRPDEGQPFDLNVLLADHARLAELAGRAGLLEQQLHEVEKRNEELHQGLVSLATRNGWLESLLEERERDIKLLTDSHPRPSFLRRLFGRKQVAEVS